MKVKDLLKVLYEFTEIEIFEYGSARGEFFYQVNVVDPKYFDREIVTKDNLVTSIEYIMVTN